MLFTQFLIDYTIFICDFNSDDFVKFRDLMENSTQCESWKDIYSVQIVQIER